MKSRNPLIVCAAVLCISCGKKEEGSIPSGDYQPELGKGVNYSETETFRSCLQNVQVENENFALEDRDYKETRIKSHKELHESLDVKASAKALGTWGRAGGSASFFKDVKINEDSFYWLVDANYEASSESIQSNAAGFGLTDEAKKVLQEQGLEAFYRMCGTHYFGGRTLGARYTMLYAFHSREDKVVEKLSAKANYGGFGISAGASFSRLLEMAQRTENLTIYSHILGGDADIADYAQNPEHLVQELKKLREDVLHERRGVAIAWFKESYDVFPEVQQRKEQENVPRLDDKQREDALSYLYDLYAENERHIATLEARLAKSRGKEPLYRYKAQTMEAMQKDIDHLKAQNSEVSTRAKACLDDQAQCDTQGFKYLQVKFPAPDEDLSGTGPWEIRTAHSHSDVDFISRKIEEEKKGNPQFFDSLERIHTQGGRYFYKVRETHGERDIQIGVDEIVEQKGTGIVKAYMCIGEFEEVCNLRMIDEPEMDQPKLQLTIFDENGFIIDQLDMLPTL